MCNRQNQQIWDGEESNEASWVRSRQAEEANGWMGEETHGGGWRDRGRHEGCMAAEAAVLYQDAAVAPRLPNSRKARSMPNTHIC